MADEKKTEYGAESIKVLEGLEGVRKRPAMYIGSTGKEGLHHLVYEIVDNAVDEALAGECDTIKVTLNTDGSVTVEDNGRGIPVEMHPVYKKSAMEVIVTKLHAGGKFDNKAYAVSGGLHGVGISVVAALSKKMIAEVRKNGNVYSQTYKIGVPNEAVKIVKKCAQEEKGTTITFFPDETIFSTVKFEFSTLVNRFREIAFLNAGLKIIFKDENTGKKEDFHFEGGLVEFVKWLNKSKEALHKPVYFKREMDGIIMEASIQYNEGYQENIFGFVNTINTVEGGTHVAGFRTALTRVINDYVKKKGLLKDDSLMGEDTREGLTAIVSIKIAHPQFEGQTKTKLGNSEIKGLVDSAVTAALGEFFEENPPIAKRICEKSLDAAKARLAAKKAKELVRRKNAFSLGGLPGKLADCASRKFEETELYLVEGESAGGCFSADTKVALADGRSTSFKDLVRECGEGKENFCYTILENGSVGIEKIKNPRITKKDAEVIKIVLDNNQEIICTPNHKFMLRNGNFKEAKDLSKEDSLMPFHKRFSKIGGRITIGGYEMIWDQNKTWIFTHMLADKYNLRNNIYSSEQGEHKHHIDFNKLNNNPTNIIRLPKENHLILHTQHLEKTIHREDVKEKAKISHQAEEYRQKVREWANKPEVNKMLSDNAKKQWKNEEYKNFMIKKFKEFIENNPKYADKNRKLLNEEQKKYWENSENRKIASENVKIFFEKNPEAKKNLSNISKEQWKDEVLLIWRRQKTKEQWTPKFREKRKIAYDKTYYENTIKLMKSILEKSGDIDNFDIIRTEKNDKNVLSKKTFCKKFFENNNEMMLEAVNNYNHKIKRIEFLNEKIDVYDLEVPGTHNFALASGIFVHNSAKQSRNKHNQAILPLKGKILNIEKANISKALSSEEIANMITVIGAGVGEQFDIEKLRYNKIIIMTDADVDGEHIKTLLLTFFFRFMPKLIENGNIFVALPPLFRIRKKEDYYVYTEDELKKMTDKLGANSTVTRFKGLGEMSSDQLWETTMDPKTRKIKKIYIEDAIEADATFSMLMGDDVQSRKEFIQENAKEANLDI